jgi:transcriptional regulator with XRE-family HTH domain
VLSVKKRKDRRIGRVIRDLRSPKDIGLRELATKAGVTSGYLANLESGKRQNPSLDVLKRVAEALGVDVKELL